MMNYFKEAICFDPVNYYILLEEKDLINLKNKLSKEDIDQLEIKLKDIHKSYRKEKCSVVFKKEHLMGGHIKDYVSLATYYWPNPLTKDHLPYVLKDGEANPEGIDYDKDKLRELAFICYYEALLYFLTNKKEYYELLKDNISYFFLEKETGMNPNLEHAQMIRGINLGRGIGVIDFTANFTYAIRMIKILNDLGLIEKGFYDSFGVWLRKLAEWMCFSKIGLEEKYAKNNHGIFYDLGLAAIFDYLNDDKQFAPLVSQMIEYRLVYQIDKDGSMPAENQRTKSKNYSLMALKGIYDFNTIVNKYGYDFYAVNSWYCRNVHFSVQQAMDFMIKRMILKEKSWYFKQIIPFDEATLLPLIFECQKRKLLVNIPNIQELKMKCDLLRVFID